MRSCLFQMYPLVSPPIEQEITSADFISFEKNCLSPVIAETKEWIKCGYFKNNKY